MFNRGLTFLVIICLGSAGGLLAAERPLLSRDGLVIHGSGGVAQAVSDTINLMGAAGGGAPYTGDFDSGWNGWTSSDLTQPTSTHWQVSDFNQADAGNLAAWCGDLGLTGCAGGGDVAGGYGNNWHDLLVYRATVANPALAAEVTVTSVLQYDTEPGYDFLRLSISDADGRTFTDLQVWDGSGAESTFHVATFLPSEFLGGTDVAVWFRFQSDDGWSDEDCRWPSVGAAQIDDISVTTRQSGQADLVSFTDFQDGTFGDWIPAFPTGVGDFANLWSGLEELDNCATDYSQLVAFIDDGQVVTGTGGTTCINWCYGPGGYIVNTSGGLAGPAAHLHNVVDSPVMSWPDASRDGITLSYDLFRHEELGADAVGMFVTWSVRSADTDGSAGHGVQSLGEQPFKNHELVYYGHPIYLRPTHNVTGVMNPGRDEVQVRLGVYELGWVWGWNGNDGHPAPYFDNVAVKVFAHTGPALTAREVDLAQDNFPEIDVIDPGNLGSLHVRFDMARNISSVGDLRNDPGDSVVVDIVPARSGAALAAPPVMHYTIAANPLFDAFRTLATSGIRTGVPAVGAAGVAHPTAWAFDLPDTGGLFPGDVLHYYISASDQVAGDVQQATLPSDLTGFGDFSTPGTYDGRFVVRALPTIVAGAGGSVEAPGLLLWNDFAAGAPEQIWHSAFASLSLVPGVDYDTYYTNGPDSGVGNGLGGRTAGPALAFYNELCYSSGDLGTFTISNGDFRQDAGDDMGALRSWLAAGNKDVFLTGDNLAFDLGVNAGAEGRLFTEEVMGLDVVTGNIRTFIANQATPLILTVPEAPVFESIGSWIAYGGCLSINTFDGVTTRAGAVRLAEFTNLSGNLGAYSFSAATLNISGTNRIVSLPYDFAYLYSDPNATAQSTLPARTQVLKDVLSHFDVVVDDITVEPEFSEFAMRLGPNPFFTAYQRMQIGFTLKAPGDLRVKVYDVRGQMVLTLFDGPVDATTFVRWSGADENGVALASGVYFVEAQMGAAVLVRKFALVR